MRISTNGSKHRQVFSVKYTWQTYHLTVEDMLLVIEAGVCFFLPIKMGLQFTNISSLLPNALRAMQVFETS